MAKQTIKLDYGTDYDTCEGNAPDSFSIGCINMVKVKSIRMVFWGRSYSAPTDTVYLFGRELDNNVEGSQVFLHAFQLPDGEADYQKELRLYDEQRRDFKMEHGQEFHENFLAPQQVAPDFVHQAFRTRDGKARRRIVRVYKADDRAAIIVFSLNSANFSSNKFFKKVCDSLNIS